MKKTTKKSKIVALLLFAAGLSLLLYPLVANQWNAYRQSRLIGAYEATVEQMEDAGELDYQAQKDSAYAYNQALLPRILPDPCAVAKAKEADSEYLSCLNLAGDGMMGRIEIPKIDVNIPIFHTTKEEVLQKAAGHLEGSSLPVGGENTHAVISAHRGLPSATLFTDLDQLQKGDHFLLYILDDVLCYQVDQITVSEPEDTSALAVEDGRDLVTLLTCTPYSVNSHRLLVRGSRVDYVESAMEQVPTALFGVSAHTSYLLWVLVGCSVTGICILFLFLLEKKRKRAALPACALSAGTETKRREYQDYDDMETYDGYVEYTDYENCGYIEYEENDSYEGYRDFDGEDDAETQK